MLERLRHRLYHDFVMPSRLDEYARVIDRARELGYGFHSVGSFHDAKRAGRLEPKALLLRCDVDTDVATAAEMFEILRAAGARASFFFRLSTLDVALMRRMHECGFEASYHFEEVSTVAKELRLRTRAEVEARLADIEQRFCANVQELRAETGLPIVVLAAHGDWVNRRLEISNRRVLTQAVREELGIELEAYDPAVAKATTSRFVDADYPELWRPGPPLAALERGDPVVQVLTHPRPWTRNIRVNLRADAQRAREEADFRIPRWTSSAPH
jgi:hypothetical protein